MLFFDFSDAYVDELLTDKINNAMMKENTSNAIKILVLKDINVVANHVIFNSIK